MAARDLPTAEVPPAPHGEADRELLARYVEAFERYDIDSLTSLLHEDATQSMPPYEMWLRGRTDILGWWFGPGIRLPRLAAGARRGQRAARVRAVPAEPRRRVRAVGAQLIEPPDEGSRS